MYGASPKDTHTPGHKSQKSRALNQRMGHPAIPGKLDVKQIARRVSNCTDILRRVFYKPCWMLLHIRIRDFSYGLHEGQSNE